MEEVIVDQFEFSFNTNIGNKGNTKLDRIEDDDGLIKVKKKKTG